MSTLWRGDLQDHRQVDLLEVTDERGHFESHYRLIKSCFSLLVIQRRRSRGPCRDRDLGPREEAHQRGVTMAGARAGHTFLFIRQ